MPLTDDQAATIALACVKKVGGHEHIAVGDQLGSAGVGSKVLIDNLVDRICNDVVIGVPSAGFRIKPGEFGSINNTCSVVDVSNVISKKSTAKG
jgi:hypothetical protein